MTESDQRNTAYAHNTRAQSPSRRRMIEASRWHPKIRELFERDYAFLGYGYPSGVLFRGLSRGIGAMLRTGRWQINDDGSHVGALERELGVHLLSHELTDALTVSRLWQAGDDAGVIVFPAGEFSARQRNGAAAMIGLAEPGVVFKYPFVVEPLPLAVTSLLVLPANAPTFDCEQATVRVPVDLAGDRGAVEEWVRTLLRERQLVPAVPEPATDYPR